MLNAQQIQLLEKMREKGLFKEPIACERPLYLPKQNIYTNCDNCLICRQNQAREWTLRIMLECFEHIKPYPQAHDLAFITLTYDNEHLPPNESLNKWHIQGNTGFIKRIRREWKKQYNYNLPFRSIATGEYGELKDRPHYHLLLTNIKPQETYLLDSIARKVWKYGERIQIEQVFSINGIAKYISQYVTKKIGKVKMYKEAINGKEPEFIRVSTHPYGIGYRFIQQPFIKNNLKINNQGKYEFMIGGKTYTLPRYLRRKWEEENLNENEQERAKMLRMQNQQTNLNLFMDYEIGMQEYSKQDAILAMEWKGKERAKKLEKINRLFGKNQSLEIERMNQKIKEYENLTTKDIL